ncbi:post-transcriptional regulator [Rubeoparvulum massiliense]|uniref:post-transcriptional regulator n=1 Tax=Rubeoparvulum massiliense TaxID=1631346 RepID=UPI00065E9048|nr:post-transcriptional regulator [Rubeoparvulum massiliense]
MVGTKVMRSTEGASHEQVTTIEVDPHDGKQDELLHYLCQSKAEEFQLLGYYVTRSDLVEYFTKKYRNIHLPLHAWTQEILSLRVTTYMDWMMLQALYTTNRSKLTVES